VSDKPVKKKPVGRPTKYKGEETCNALIEHMARGLSYESFGAVINVNRSNIYEWEKKHPEFRDAKKEAFEKNRLFWESVGVEGTLGNIKNFNATMWIFNMKNRFPNEWKDRSELKQDLTLKTVEFKVEVGEDGEFLTSRQELLPEPD